MHIASMVVLTCGCWFSAPGWAADAFGSWKVNPARSTAPYSGGLTVRIEPHSRGEVFSVDRVDDSGRSTTFSTIFYFDGRPRGVQDFTCSGFQSTKRMDNGTVEILRKCVSGERIRVIRRPASQANELVLEISEQHPDGRRVERRLVLERQQSTK